MEQNFKTKSKKNNIMLFLYFVLFLMSFTLLQSVFAQNPLVSNTKISNTNLTNVHLIDVIPTDFKLYENSVNAQAIRFDIPEISNIKITIYDKKGGIVKGYLYDNIQPGTHELNVADLDNGNYTYTMISGDFSQSYNMLVTK